MPRIELLQGWLRRTLHHPAKDRLVLRGSLLTLHFCPGARVPQDVDHLVVGNFDPVWMARVAGEIAALSDPETHLQLLDTETIWAETPFPGLRAHLMGQTGDLPPEPFQVDFAFGDPLTHPPEPVPIQGVGRVQACLPEILVAWKLHGLTEFGRGRWRAKDLYDLHLLVSGWPLDFQVLAQALPVAFGSRGSHLTDLEDFRLRESWGCSFSGQRKWRSFLKKNGLNLDFLQARASVRAAVERGLQCKGVS